MATYVFKQGFEWNPLRRHRNLPCPCGSKKKIKRCHGKVDALTHEDAEKARIYLRMLSAYGWIEGREEYGPE